MYDDVILTEKKIVKLRNILNNKLGRVHNETATDLFEGILFFQNLSTGSELLRIPVPGQKLEGKTPKFGAPPFFLVHQLWKVYLFYDYYTDNKFKKKLYLR